MREPFCVVRVNPLTGLPVTRKEYVRFRNWAVRRYHPEVRKAGAEDTSKRQWAVKERVFKHYSLPRCDICGLDDMRCLVLHHTNNDGKEHREQLGVMGSIPFYRRLEEQGYPDGLEVLCANCHAIQHSKR